ncbi:helix-turn-helix domain-containing protein [Paenibacillaceae bacterium WGS1546]|uniref:response regulator transcription factor n=1 Tax=Cohnella sp. WGS1546 TaxID=3366810 RepID=UPI00372CFC46
MKICVADDEREVRSSIVQKLIRLFPKERIFDVGFGYEALEQIGLIRPDLLFLDIRMPELDGLELLRQVKIQQPLIHAVIISGYDDFEYARASLQHGAMNYLLKPADPQELKANVEAARRMMEETFRQEMELLISRHPNPYIRYDRLEPGDLSPWFDDRELKAVRFGEAGDKDEEGSAAADEEPAIFGFATPSGMQVSVVRAAGSEAEGFTDKQACLPYLIAKLQKREEERFFGERRPAISAQWRKETLKLAHSRRLKLLACATEATSDRLAPLLEEWLACLPGLDLEELRRECANLMAALDEAMRRPGMIIVEGDAFAYWLDWASEHDAWSRLQAGIRSIVLGGLRAMKQVDAEAKEALSGNWFDQALRLLETSEDPDLSLEAVAARVNVHPVTLSRMFKQQMGVNFVKYATSRRLELARKELLATDKRIDVIADEAGYGDHRYFRQLFKKEFGLSPSEYRRRNGFPPDREEPEESN